MMKVRTAVLVSAGAASGLVSGLAVAAAAPAGAAMIGGGGGCTDGNPYLVRGQVTAGPDAGSELTGQLCIQSAARGVTVIGAVRELPPFTREAAVVPAPTGLPLDVSGTTPRQNIRYDGRFRGAFIQATGSQVPPLVEATPEPFLAVRPPPPPSYGGTFQGLQRGDLGTWRADPADIARAA